MVCVCVCVCVCVLGGSLSLAKMLLEGMTPQLIVKNVENLGNFQRKREFRPYFEVCVCVCEEKRSKKEEQVMLITHVNESKKNTHGAVRRPSFLSRSVCVCVCVCV
jgi:hypothetical protein